MESKNTLALIDADSILYIVCPNKVLRYDDGAPMKDDSSNTLYESKTLEETLILCDSLVSNILTAIGTTKYIGVLSPSKTFRYQVNPNYKANRKGREKPPFFNEVIDYLKTKYKFLIIPEFEADDVVVSLKGFYSNNYDCTLATTDKDLLKLPGRHYNYKKVEFVETNADEAYDYFWYSMIVGDTADNIKGIPGMGDKKTLTFMKKIQRQELPKEVLSLYMNYFGESKGIAEFFMNYKCLKIVEDIVEMGLDESSVPVVNEYE
jgi:5'-3' exonuclease